MEFTWRKSTRSGGSGGNCVEVGGGVPGVVGVRDSKDPTGPMLVFDRETFAAFVTDVKRGRYDR